MAQMAKKLGGSLIIITYKSWDDPPSNPPFQLPNLDGHRPVMGDQWPTKWGPRHTVQPWHEPWTMKHLIGSSLASWFHGLWYNAYIAGSKGLAKIQQITVGHCPWMSSCCLSHKLDYFCLGFVGTRQVSKPDMSSYGFHHLSVAWLPSNGQHRGSCSLWHEWALNWIPSLGAC